MVSAPRRGTISLPPDRAVTVFQSCHSASKSSHASPPFFHPPATVSSHFLFANSRAHSPTRASIARVSAAIDASARFKWIRYFGSQKSRVQWHMVHLEPVQGLMRRQRGGSFGDLVRSRTYVKIGMFNEGVSCLNREHDLRCGSHARAPPCPSRQSCPAACRIASSGWQLSAARHVAAAPAVTQCET
jgi:hypothetical protein